MITLLSTPYYQEALLLKIALEAQGIPAFLSEALLMTDGLLDGGVQARVYVPAERREEAQAVMAEHYARRRERHGAPDAGGAGPVDQG